MYVYSIKLKYLLIFTLHIDTMKQVDLAIKVN